MDRTCKCLMITKEMIDNNEKMLNIIKQSAIVYEPNIKTYFIPTYDPIASFLKIRFPEIDNTYFEFCID